MGEVVTLCRPRASLGGGGGGEESSEASPPPPPPPPSELALAEILAAVSPAPGSVAWRPGHCRQRESWDCGIACVMMVLPGRSWDEVARACGTRSIWTVDLAHALESLGGGSFVMTTKTLGCDPSYRGLPFYSRELGRDETRVRERFASANFAVRLGSVSPRLLNWLIRDEKMVAIALVDLGILKGKGPKHTYTGHYVLLYGVRESDGHLLYHDPAADASGPLAVSPHDLHMARTAHGTDEDLILIRPDAR